MRAPSITPESRRARCAASRWAPCRCRRSSVGPRSRPKGRRFAAIAAFGVAMAAALAVMPSASARTIAEPAGTLRLVPPVPGPPVDGFRPPRTPYGPANLGIEYAPAVGGEVVAPAGGEVVFAGPVAGRHHVTVAAADGVRVTVSWLENIEVRRGAQVRAGQRLGTASGPLLLSVRIGDEYVDPAPFLQGRAPSVRLVPTDARLPSYGPDALAAEQAALAMLGDGPGLDDVFGAGLSLLGGLAGADPLEVLTAWQTLAGNLSPIQTAWDLGVAVERWWSARDTCTPPDAAVAAPKQRRIAVLVGGFGSSSARAGIDELDLDALGYSSSDVVRFSYRGGRIPAPVGADLAGIAERAYEPSDTTADLGGRGAALAALLRDVAAAAPGIPIDVFAHSQGGIVTRVALTDASLPASLDTVVTIASPHGGAPFATAGVALDGTVAGELVLTVAGAGGGMDLHAPSPAQLAESSPLLDEFGAPPEGVWLTSIGARGDIVVPAGAAYVAGAHNAVVPVVGWHAHESVISHPATTREALLAMAHRAPTCDSLGDALLDAASSEVLTAGESALGLLAAGVAGSVPAPSMP